MQEGILEKYPNAPLKVYAIWTNKLFMDSRGQWDAAGLTDPRVVHLWDQADLTGAWLVNDLPGFRGSDWDAFALFGADAMWSSQPPALLSSGTTIIGKRDELERAVQTLLGAS